MTTIVYGRDGVWYSSVNVSGFTYFRRLDLKAPLLHDAMVMHVLDCRLDSEALREATLQQLVSFRNFFQFLI